MKQLTSLIFVLFASAAFAQQRQAVEIPQEILKSIAKDVWVPFMESYQQSDSKKLKSVHSKDIVRVTMDNNRIETGEAYLDHFGSFVENVKKQGRQMDIAFALLTTAINEDQTMAYQTGYYRFSSKGPDDENFAVRGYGHFYVGLIKENSQWKLWLDSDGRTNITSEDFNAQETIYELKG
ncbi:MULTISPECIES: DUF4440 domain-containing protein [Flavobacteriaceae]|uniref:DUF4440 domain-containing protein n=1 Tax=Flavobacteriaceae TaxID=49546 RepID=UPI00149177C5|nr:MULTISPECIES: DUF4440 domain-containing protein [Allomuricauda]MDC6364763.1 DUF4440 domain-containing protein [Muricauda sp. AC10]